ncbi:aldo/keto reductase [Bifidobacterium avesanii]|uniref:Aldo/keto reductase n=2 Tax=Bifidobacterium avesanii TaxID=1798157 RepID=A0A7K3TFH0_9BIFI|nr:aldo/keto reductase [Bifidobacterium avesanii]
MQTMGMGTWHMAEDANRRADEIAALREGVDLGVKLIDTAELYGDGEVETLVGEAIRGLDRSELCIVSKVIPSHAGHKDMRASCEASLKRLGTDYLDLYLLHWPGAVPLEETVACMESLRADGLIRRWGVSNFDVDDMEALWRVPGGDSCVANQVLYHLESRGVEVSLKPWMRDHGVAMMAYSPLAQGGRLAYGLRDDPTLNAVAGRHDATPVQIMLAWAMRDGETIAIPKAGSPAHMRLNVEAAGITLTPDDLAALDRRFPAPARKPPLDWL